MRQRPCEYHLSRLIYSIEADIDGSTLRNQKDSPLLRLPAELRNQIYAYTFKNLKVRTATRFGPYPSYEPGYCCVLLPYHVSALLNSATACRQIHIETDLLFFKNTELDFTVWSTMVKTLSRIEPRQRMAIKTICIGIYSRPIGRNICPIKHMDGLEHVHLECAPEWQNDERDRGFRRALRKLFDRADLQCVRRPMGPFAAP
jgi:hypothetical protein